MIELPIKAYDYEGMKNILSLIKPYQMVGKPMQPKTKRYYLIDLGESQDGVPTLTFTHANKMAEMVHCHYDIKEMRLTKTGGLRVYCMNDSRVHFEYEFK